MRFTARPAQKFSARTGALFATASIVAVTTVFATTSASSGSTAARTDGPRALVAHAATLTSGMLASQGLSWPAKYSSDGNAANITAAHADAAKLLTLVPAPSDATVLASKPTWDVGPLSASTWNKMLAYKFVWWTTSIAPTTLIRDFERTPPTGSVLTTSGGGCSGLASVTTRQAQNSSCSEMAIFQWPAIVDVLGYRTVELTAAELPDGQTGVQVEAQSQWVQLRPTSEQIPAGVASIRVRSSLTGSSKRSPARTVTRTFTSAARISSVTALIDAMPIVQDTGFVYSCPLELAPDRTVTVGFYSASGRRLALMSYAFYHGSVESAGICSPSVALKIGNRWRTPLIGGYFVYKLERLVGMKLR